MDLKAPKKRCALREIFRHKYCPYSEISPLHPPLSVAQQKTCAGCPLQHCIAWEQTLRAPAAISCCVERLRDKGSLWCRGDGKRLQGGTHMYVVERSPAFFRSYQGLSLHLLAFLGFCWEGNFLMSCEWHQDWNRMHLASTEMGGQHNMILFFPACTFLWQKEQNCFKRETKSN